jgi:hypothetical protein
MKRQMVEALPWTSAKACTGGQCIQVAAMGDSVAVRDSKNPDGAILTYSVDEWTNFLKGVKNGDFDDVI